MSAEYLAIFYAGALARAVIAPFFTRLAEEMRPPLFEIDWVPTHLPNPNISTDDPRAAILALVKLFL